MKQTKLSKVTGLSTFFVVLALILAACAPTAVIPITGANSTSVPQTNATATLPVAAMVAGTLSAGMMPGGIGSTMMIANDPKLGSFLVDAKGMTVYLFAIDSPGHSACTGACLQYWPLVPTPATLPTSLPGITGTVGVLDRPDGAKQLTLNGWPLYTYAGDTAPGMTAGEGLNLSGGLWWAVSPSGSAVKSTGPGSSPSSSSGGYTRSY